MDASVEADLFLATYIEDDLLPLEKALGMLPDEYRLVLGIIKKSNNGHIEICIKCEEKKELTNHHIFPQRHFGNGEGNNVILRICRACHDKIEKIIPEEEKPNEFYVVQLYDWFSQPHGFKTSYQQSFMPACV